MNSPNTPCPHCGDKALMPFCDCPMSIAERDIKTERRTVIAEAEKEPCKCWETVNAKIAEHGVKISESLRVMTLPNFTVEYIIPLEGLNGKIKRSQPRHIQMSYCPFCGGKFTHKKEVL